MIRIEAVIARYPDLDAPHIVDWVARGWVHAEDSDGGFVFTEFEIARLHLLHDLQVDLALDTETVPLVLSLLDQVYDLRRSLRSVLDVLAEAPPEIRQRVHAALAQSGPG